MNKTLKLALTAMLTALSVVANLFTVPIGHNNAISFTFVACFVAGVYLGIVPALAVGYLGDLVAHFIYPLGPYNWFIALSSLLVGLVVALCYKLPVHKLWKLACSAVLWFLTCTCFLNTLGLWLQYVVGVDPSPVGLWQFFTMEKSGIQKSFWVYLAGRAPYQLINTAVNVAIVALLQQTKALDKVFEKISRPQNAPLDQSQSDVTETQNETENPQN